jgi:hypothetical protein
MIHRPLRISGSSPESAVRVRNDREVTSVVAPQFSPFPMLTAVLTTHADYAKQRGRSDVTVHKATESGHITMIADRIGPTVADLNGQSTHIHFLPQGRVTPVAPFRHNGAD